DTTFRSPVPTGAPDAVDRNHQNVGAPSAPTHNTAAMIVRGSGARTRQKSFVVRLWRSEGNSSSQSRGGCVRSRDWRDGSALISPPWFDTKFGATDHSADSSRLSSAKLNVV